MICTSHDACPGMATETTYTYESASGVRCTDRMALIRRSYHFSAGAVLGVHTVKVVRWQFRSVGQGEVGVAVGATPDEANARAYEMADADLDAVLSGSDATLADPSPTWWRGAEVIA